jgi:hypothetical protein
MKGSMVNHKQICTHRSIINEEDALKKMADEVEFNNEIPVV